MKFLNKNEKQNCVHYSMLAGPFNQTGVLGGPGGATRPGRLMMGVG
jgi:hypothetical protein